MVTSPKLMTSTGVSLEPDNGGGRSRRRGLNSITHVRSRSRSRSTSESANSFSRQRSRSSVTSSFINYLSNDNGTNYRYNEKLVSLYKLLMLELNLSKEDLKSVKNEASLDNIQAYEQIVDMIKIPLILERFMTLGLLICFNAFLTLFTLVPIRIITMIIMTIRSVIQEKNYSFKFIIKNLQRVRRDAITVTIIICALGVLSLPSIDISKLYHDVRGQAQIKLYVMFGVLEVADKLCSSIGQNILTILYDPVVINGQSNSHLRAILIFIASVTYLSLHAYILIYQTVSLNVAANSYSNALLTLLFSNQFSELRSSVFKKFDREGLFQLSMSDLTERYQLSLMLGMIALRNILQINSIGQGLIPNSWQTWNKWFGVLFGPSVGVLGSEILVDWLKHCYIVKFNRLKPRIYSKFVYVLAVDYLEIFKASSVKPNVQYELSDYISLTKRIGLPLLATTVCFLRMSSNDLMSIFTVQTSSNFYSFISSGLLIIVSCFILLLLRLILGIVLLKFAGSVKQNHESQLDLDQTESTNAFASNNVILETPNAPYSSNISEVELDSSTPSKRPRPKEAKDVSILPRSPKSPDPVDLNFLPGSPNTEMSTIKPSIRSFLYDEGESMPPTDEEKRNKAFHEKYLDDYDEGLGKVLRYEMASKRIW